MEEELAENIRILGVIQRWECLKLLKKRHIFKRSPIAMILLCVIAA